MYFDRFDICEAYYLLEVYYNVGGWVRERPSNQRRRESIGVQLSRLRFRASPMLDVSRLSENGRAIFEAAITRLGLPPFNQGDECDECGADIPVGDSIVNEHHDDSCSLHPDNVV